MNILDTVSLNYTNSTLANSTSVNMTSLVNPSINETKNSYLITQNPEFQFQYISDGNFTKMAHLFRHGNMTQYNGIQSNGIQSNGIQYNGWHDNNTTINVQIVGPDGNQFSTKSTFKEIREGKFDIHLSSARAAKPGLYHVKVIMVRNGKVYTMQEQYQWGLVSVNTQKSIYRPGNTANLTIVVLDNGGHSVCNANIAMRITDPLGSMTRLSSGNGITAESQCGLYDAQYTTNSAGNYTVNIMAQNPSGVAYFGTSFLAEDSYPFDITRTASSKIDPVDNPNSFNVRLDFDSYTNATNISIQESVPSSFNVTTDGAVQTVGDSKIITWNRDLVSNQTSVQYSYSVPLQYPQLYALGPAKISYGNGQTFTEARPWFVAVDPPQEISVGSGTATTSPLNFAVTVPSSATHTVGVVSVIVDSVTPISGISVQAGTNTACSTGTQTFTLIPGSQASQGNNQIGLWNFTAPSTSDTNICVSWTGTATLVDAGFIAVNGTTQTGTIREANATSGTGTTKTTLVLPSSVSGADLIIDAAVDLSRTNAISPTDTGHTKLWGQIITLSAGGGSKNATGADILQWSPLVAANTWLASAVAIERPFTGLIENDTVSVTDKPSTGQTPKDTISITDNTIVSTGTFHSVSVQDSLAPQLSDKVETGNLVQDSLASNLSDKVKTGSLVQDTVTVTDLTNAVASKFVQLSDSVTISDQVSNTAARGVQLLDSVTMSDTKSISGRINIEARDQNNTLVPGATYTISPNPYGTNTPLTVSDGGANDNDATNNGRSVVVLVPFGSYNITMTGIPHGYNVLGNSTSYTTGSTQLDGTPVFRLVPVGTSLSNLGSTVTTTPPSLNDTTLNTWQSSFNAVKINGTNSTAVNTVQSLPPIISAGINNQTAINTAISNQATIQLQTSFASTTSGTTIINTLGVPEYSMPKSSDLVAVVPTIVATQGPSTTSSETVTTPPLDTIVPGQKMILPVEDSAIPSTGGIKELDAQSSSSAVSVGNSSDWFVIHVNNTLPTSLSSLPQGNKISLYVQVTYPYEETGQGFNWSDPSNFATPPQLTLQLPKNPAGVQTDSNGCPASDIYVYDTNTSSWTTNNVTIVSATPTSGNSSTCDVVVKVPHFSQFAVGGQTSGGTSSSSGTGTGGGGGAGSIGAGPGGAGAQSAGQGTSPAAGTFGGTLLPQLIIYNVSYDTCSGDNATIVVGTDATQVPSVIIRSSTSGVVSAQLAQVQPFLNENLNATIKKYVYNVAISPQEKSFEVVALIAADNNINTAGQTINVDTCKADITFTPSGPQVQQPVDLRAPQIFDTKFQIANAIKVQSSDISTQYVDNQPLTVYSIISSPTPLTKAELRYVTAGQDTTKYDTVSMSVTPLQISNTTYGVVGTIPPGNMHAPAVSYWVDAQNTAGKATDSDMYTIGVKPTSNIQANLQLDITLAKAQGTVRHPQAYFTNNSTMPVYGSISLLVNGSQVFASPSQVFGTGQTEVELNWNVPTTGSVATYDVQARADIYGQSFETQISQSETFPGTVAMPLSKLGPISSMTYANQTLAYAYIIHSSFMHDSGVRYKVVAPDGTCVIGAEQGCLVTNSTAKTSYNGFEPVTVDGQLYQVRYSGPDSPLERFSILSVDPIVGPWKVEIESKDSTLQTQMMNNVLVGIKYQAPNSPLITLNPR
ncbi:MAG: hypothetical protein ACREBB_07820 [Nitrosotalea sp.]